MACVATQLVCMDLKHMKIAIERENMRQRLDDSLEQLAKSGVRDDQALGAHNVDVVTKVKE